MAGPYNFFGTGSDPSSDRAAVPLFIYVYHQYLLGYGGSNEIDVAHPYAEAIKVARKFINGTLLDVDTGKPAFRLVGGQPPDLRSSVLGCAAGARIDLGCRRQNWLCVRELADRRANRGICATELW